MNENSSLTAFDVTYLQLLVAWHSLEPYWK